MPSNADVAILTYHRITDRHPPDWRFHDVPMRRFQSQMMLFSRRTAHVDGPVHRLENGRSAVLTFDDGLAGHLAIGRFLREHGLVGMFSVISGSIGAPAHLSARDVKQLAGMGHRIASHTATHRPLPALNTAETLEELRNSKAALEDMTGQTVDWLVPPGGMLSERTSGIAREVGFKVVRTMDWGYATLPLAGIVPCLPVLSRYSQSGFERLLDGKAMTWLFDVKRHAKRALGDRLYTMCRDAVARRWLSKA